MPKRLALILGGVLALLAAVVVTLPHFMKAGGRHDVIGQRNACTNNLRQIESAKRQWAAAFQKGPNDLPREPDLFGPGKYLSAIPQCPRGGSYTIGPVGQRPACSMADHTLP
jgi:hypothetical protein